MATISSIEGTNLVGAKFKNYVNNQIVLRQSLLSQRNKTNNQIVWENGKSAYVALASSVNINNQLTEVAVSPGEEQNPYETAGPDSSNGAYVIPNQYWDESDFAEQQRNAAVLPTDQINLQRPRFVQNLEIEASNWEIYHEPTPPIILSIIGNEGEERVKQLNLPGDPDAYFGNVIANDYILFGGTSYDPSSSPGKLRSGISTSSNDLFGSKAYGLGDTKMGINPMPGITSFSIKDKNMGSLREASVTIRANNREQFKIIDTLYCRVGYTMFLEWGNSIYFDNSGTYNNGNHESLIPVFLEGKKGNTDLLKYPTKFIKLIEDNRAASSGNYDGFFGRVKNFSWSFTTDGYYEVNLSLISWGDIIESLSIGGQYGNKDFPEETGGDIAQQNNSSALSSFISIAAQPGGNEFTKISGLGGSESLRWVFSTYQPWKNTLLGDLSNYTSVDLQFWSSEANTSFSQSASDVSVALDYDRSKTNSYGKIISSHAVFGPGDAHYYYVRFGDILDFIKDKLLIYHPDAENEPIVDIDTNTDNNYCYSTGFNLSADPSKVMVQSNFPFTNLQLQRLADNSEDDLFRADYVNSTGIFKSSSTTGILEDYHKLGRIAEGEYVGLIMNIYFEYKYLQNQIQELTNEDTGKLVLYDFIDNLLKTANSCLGGINRLALRIKDNNVLQIYDQNTIYGVEQIAGESSTLNLYGINGNQGSFVTDFSIKTELSNDFSTTVAVGAQAQGSVLGEDATALSKWNFGLEDRYYPQKIDSLRKAQAQEVSTEERIERILLQLSSLWLGYAGQTVFSSTSEVETTKEDPDDLSWYQSSTHTRKEWSNNVYQFPLFQIDQISTFVKLQKDYFRTLIQLKVEREAVKNKLKIGSNQIGMIPINIKITMDGLSGIRIYDKLPIDVRFIPSYYPQTLLWIIKGVSHEISNNKWTTKLDTIAVPKLPTSFDLKELQSGFITMGRDGGVGAGNSYLTVEELADSTVLYHEPEVAKYSTNTNINAFAKKVNEVLTNSTTGMNYSDSIKASVVFLASQEQNFRGFNYNYYGIQTDKRQAGIEPYIDGSFNSTEGSGGQGVRVSNTRYFASFKTEADGILFTAEKLTFKGWEGVNENTIAEKYYGTWLFWSIDNERAQQLLANNNSTGNPKGTKFKTALDAIKNNR
jgi:hypothetical protein